MSKAEPKTYVGRLNAYLDQNAAAGRGYNLTDRQWRRLFRKVNVALARQDAGVIVSQDTGEETGT